MDIHTIQGRLIRSVGDYFADNETMTAEDFDRLQREANPLNHLYSVYVSRNYNRPEKKETSSLENEVKDK